MERSSRDLLGVFSDTFLRLFSDLFGKVSRYFSSPPGWFWSIFGKFDSGVWRGLGEGVRESFRGESLLHIFLYGHKIETVI